MACTAFKERLENASAAVHKGTEKAFEKLSTVVVESPWITIGSCVLFTIVMAQGIWLYDEELSADKQFTPRDSRAVREEDWVVERFGQDSRQVTLMIEADEGTSMLTRESLLFMQEAHEWMLSRSLIVDGVNVTYDVVCSRYSSTDPCKTPISVLSFWQHNRTLLEADADPLRTINTVSWREIEPTGPPLSYYLGEAVRSSNDSVQSARAVRMTYDLKNEKEEISGIGEDDPQSRYFEIMIAETSADRRGQDRTAHKAAMFILTVAQENVAGDDAIQQDVISLIIGYMLLLFYASFVLSRGRVKYSHSLLGIVSVVSVGLSTFAAYGFCWLIGVKFNNVVQVLVLVLLGVGVDDTFVIMDSWWDCAHLPDMKERMITALKHAGPAITITSVTDLIAFLAGSSTALPALKDFCYYASVGIAFDFVFQCTFVVAIAYLDSVRQEKARADMLCCVPVTDDSGVCVNKDEPWSEGDRGIQKRVVGTYLPRLLLHPIGKLVVLLMTLFFLAIGIFGCTKVKMNYDNEWFIPDGHAIEDAIDVRDRYFARSELPANAYFGDIDYPNQQEVVLRGATILRRNVWAVANSTSSWMEDFQMWVQTEQGAHWDTTNAKVVPGEFYRLLRQYASTATGPRAAWQHIDNIRWKADGSGLTASRIGFFIVGAVNSDGEDAVDAMDNLRAELDGVAFPWAFSFVFWEAYKLIIQEITRNVAIAGSCVFLLVTIMIANIQLGLLVTVAIGCVDVCMIGFMPFIGVELNGVSVVSIVLAVGLSVDYSVHIANAFLHVGCEDIEGYSGREQRAAFALWKMGPAVVNGGVSTFLAILPVAFAVSYVFKVFFRMFAMIIFFGQWFGVLVVPLLLSLVGPDQYLSAPDLNATPYQNPLHPDHDEPRVAKPSLPADEELEATRNAPESV